MEKVFLYTPNRSLNVIGQNQLVGSISDGHGKDWAEYNNTVGNNGRAESSIIYILRLCERPFSWRSADV